MADVVQGDAMRDLIEPGSRVLRFLQGVVTAVGLDERVLGQISREVAVTDHAQQVSEDLRVVEREQLLDSRSDRGVLHPVAHGAGAADDELA